jgi:phenylacetate-coenzyme A ligase PaaK-like adenylate-forming protein
MFMTAVHQLRIAAMLARGAPVPPGSVEHLVHAMVEARREFGPLPSAIATDATTPRLSDEDTARIQLQRFREAACAAARETVFYRSLFPQCGLDPHRLATLSDIDGVPLTRKQDLRERSGDFISERARPAFLASTTGTTGTATCVAFSMLELRVIAAMSALAFAAHGQICAEDIVQISASARAGLGNIALAGACALLGAPVYLAGMIDPLQTLDLLRQDRQIPHKKGRVSVLSIYPSYLGQLVEAGLAHDYAPRDFGLERVLIGGEIVTEGLRARARRLFGPIEFVEGYAATETIPFGGQACEDGHLHFEISRGLLEILPLTTQSSAECAGSLVVTPFNTFRQTTRLVRYDTEDVVTPARGPLTCHLRDQPATSAVLGRRSQCMYSAGRWIFPRGVLEALESTDAVPVPARVRVCGEDDGVNMTVVARDDSRRVQRDIEVALVDHGVPVSQLHVTTVADLAPSWPLRSDTRAQAQRASDSC